jgi:glutamate 5-kinase
MNTQDIISKADIIVIKIGTALVVNRDGASVRQEWLDALAADISALRDQGKQVVIVSSGAVALGRNTLGIPLDMPPALIPLEKKQACSAIGQFHVFNGFHKAFEAHSIKHAQVLLTMSETENRRNHLNARAALEELMNAGVVPIINENDVISTEEIRFGDNDRLAARVAQMVNATAVILLSTTDGLYTANPDTDKDAQHLPVIERITDEHMSMAGEAVPGMSTGGMQSKLEAAKAATLSGVHLIIANGLENGALGAVLSDKNTRTSLFLALETTNNAKKRWIGAHMKTKGAVIIDKGALNALKNGKSLLPVGVVDISGEFERGDAIDVLDEQKNKVATGLSAYSSKDAAVVMGRDTHEIKIIMGYLGRDELIHRNDMVLQD